MDLQLAFRVLWRFRVIVALGLLIGLVLAFLALVKISPSSSPHFKYRTQPQYESHIDVGLTTEKFPWWSLRASAGAVDIDTLRSLATVYPKYATGNQVRRILLRSGGLDGQISTFPELAPDSSGLPMFGLSYVAPTAARANSLAARHFRAFQQWILINQNRDGTRPASRIILWPVDGPTPATLIAGRKMTKPILIFLGFAVLTIALAFILENVRPRIRPVAEEEDEEQPDQRAA